MKRALERDHALSSGRGARKFQRALHRFGAGVAKENGVEMRRRAFRDRFRQQSAQERAIHLHHVRQIEIEHVADRLLHHRMIAPDVENAVAAQKIEVGGVIHVVEIRALGPRIDLVETDHALRRDERAVDVPLVQLVILAQPRGDDFFQVKTHVSEILPEMRWKRKCAPARSTTKSRRIREEPCGFRILAGTACLGYFNLRQPPRAQPRASHRRRCNTPSPSDRSGAALLRSCPRHRRSARPFRAQSSLDLARSSR